MLFSDTMMYIVLLVHLRLFKLTVTAPRRLTTLRCFPKCCIILISPINDVKCALSTGGLAIFTATVDTSSPFIIPTAVAFSCLI